MITGVVESTGPRYGWTERGGVVAVQPLFTDEGRAIRKVVLTDCYLDDYEPVPETARVYLDEPVEFLVVDGSYPEGATVTVDFDAEGAVTQVGVPVG